MANELNIDLGQTGLTVTAVVIQNNAAVGSPVALSESGDVVGFYSGNFPSISAGDYQIRFLSGSTPVGYGELTWNGTAEISFSDLSLLETIEDHTRPMAKQLGLITGVTATHSPTAIVVSDGDGSTTITDNGNGSYTVAKV